MALKGILSLLLVALSLSWSNSHEEAGWSISSSSEEDLEMERQLKILNKPPVKTIQNEVGDTIDCIDINKQPALDHPLLINHKIQMRPTTFQKRGTNGASSTVEHSSIGFKNKGCPLGTVPIRRTRKEDLLGAKLLSKSYPSIHPLGNGFRNQHYAFVRTRFNSKTYHGARANINLYNPKVEQDQFSGANIWIENGPPDQRNYIIAGWMVSPQLFGDSKTRITTYWTGDGYHKTGCYNTLCSGFVQVSREIAVGAPVSNISVPDGRQFTLNVKVFQDPKTGDWWLAIQENNINIGYWPKSILPHLAGGSTFVAWGGIAQGSPNGASPPMGSGIFPDNNFKHCAYFRQMQIINATNNLEDPKKFSLETYKDNGSCYDVIYYGYRGEYEGHMLLFGGPGGMCGK